MSVESTREVMLRYFGASHGDTSMMAEDVENRMIKRGRIYFEFHALMAQIS